MTLTKVPGHGAVEQEEDGEQEDSNQSSFLSRRFPFPRAENREGETSQNNQLTAASVSNNEVSLSEWNDHHGFLPDESAWTRRLAGSFRWLGNITRGQDCEAGLEQVANLWPSY